MMSIQARLQGELQGHIDTQIYKRKKIGPSPEDQKPEARKIGLKPEPRRLQISEFFMSKADEKRKQDGFTRLL